MRWGTFALLTSGLLVTPTVRAEPPALDLRGFAPPMDPNGSLALEPVTTPGHGNFSTSLWSSYAYRLVRIEDSAGHELSVPIRHQLSYDVLVNAGLGNRLAFGLDLPVVAYQKGTSLAEAQWSAPKTALADPTLEIKAVIIPKGALGGLGLAGLSRLTFPLGSDESAVGSGAVTAELGLRGELDLVLAGIRASLGYVWRAEDRVFLGDQFGDYTPWALGVFFKPQALGWDQSGRMQWFVEGRGSVAITPEFATKHSSPVSLGLGTRYALGADLSTIAGLELPLNSALGAPSLRAVLGLSWAPRFLDADDDGIPDDADDCPEGMPEDRDGFEDDDGCPDDDNDADGVSDTSDQCPKQQEDLDEFRDDDGCPDPDNDQDGILDVVDACPLERGVPSKSKKYNGCPRKDSDGDGLFDDVDQCPERAEDLDGFHDEDGCPDPDNDADGLLDSDDDCPTQRGPKRSVAGLNGCPNPDPDDDTYFGTVGDAFSTPELFAPDTRPVGTARDLCPREAEDFDGDSDDDGCFDAPDPKRKSPVLVSFEITGQDGWVKFSRAPTWSGANSESLAASDEMLLRALAKELAGHKDWTAEVGVRPTTQNPAQVELAKRRADRIVQQLRRLVLRDSCARTVEFAETGAAPFAKQSGLGIALHISKRH